jgi:sugar/nucleoside kinase (ribokinase family)
MINGPDVVVIGDLNLDSLMIGNLPFEFNDLKENGIITWAPISDEAGGGALNLARFAYEAGYRVMILGRVGDDFAGRSIMAWLNETN